MYLVDLDQADKTSIVMYDLQAKRWVEFFDGIAIEIRPIVVDAFLTKEQIERINKQTDIESDFEEVK